MNKLGTKLGAIAMSAVMALTFAPSAAITSLAAGGDDLTDATKELSTPVYRLYNPTSGEHLFTTNENECDSLDKGGWDYEDIAWYAPTEGDKVYRLYNPNHPFGDHHYTASQSEVDNLLNEGWRLDQTAFYTAEADDLLRDEVISLYNPNAYALGQATHHLTLSEKEAADLVKLGWVNEGVKFYGYAADLDPEVDELTVSIDNTTPKVGDTLTATVTGGAGTATYQWLADGAEIDGATDDELLVTLDMVGKQISVEVTDAEGNTAVSDETDPVVADLAFDVELVDESGYQEDGTALVGDTLGVIYGASFGTPSAITWYVNGAVKDTYVSTTVGQFQLSKATNRGYLGEVYAVVENTAGEKAMTNTITVTDVELPIEVSDIEILNDYDTPALSYNSQDADAIVTVTMSKKVDGDLYIYKNSVSKYGNGNNTFKISIADFNDATAVDKASQLTVKNAVATAAATVGCTGIYFQDADGTTTYMLKVADGGMDAGFSPVRGTTYKAVFDQDGVSTDNIGATTRNDVEVSDSFTAPYLEAPASIALTSRSNGVVPKITFYDEEGAEVTWLANPGPTTAQNSGFGSVITYGETGSAKNKAKRTKQDETVATITKGVLTGDTQLDANSSYFWATVTTAKGIYGATAETLESEIVEATERPFTVMNIVDDSTNPKDAVITFSKLKTNGSVYVLQHTAGGQAAAVTAFDADDTATYVGKADVEKGDTKVTLSGILESYADSAAAGTHYYTAYFVPENTEDYSIAYAGTFNNTKQSVKSGDVSSNLFLNQIPTSIAYDEDGAAEAITSQGSGLDKETTISDVIAGNKIKAYDQFGDLMANAQNAKTVTSCTAVNNTLTTTEDANAQFAISAAGLVTINLYRDTAVDAGDGFDVTILGTTVKVRATNFVNDPTGTGYFSVAIGSDTVVKTAVGAAKTINGTDTVTGANTNAGTYTFDDVYVLDADLNPVANTVLATSNFTAGTTGITAVVVSTDNSGNLVLTTTGNGAADAANTTVKVLGGTLTIEISNSQKTIGVSWVAGA